MGIIAFLTTALVSMRYMRISNVDFRAFYCLGAAVAIHANPYLVEPLRACELNGDIYAQPLRSGMVMPSPAPGYDLAAFTFLAHLPYARAVLAWGIILWSAVFLIGASSSRLKGLTGAPWNVLLAAFILSDGYASSLTGNLLPIAVAGLGIAAWCVSRRHYVLAALGVLLAMCEIHVGLGALSACFLFMPRSRGALFMGACMLGALTYATTGVTRDVGVYSRCASPSPRIGNGK